MNRNKTAILPFILVTSLFLMWGLANNMTDTLLAAFKRIMSMTDFQTSWVQFSFYGAYFCLALPAALFIKRFTYKSGILLGLGLFILGALLFYPASKTQVYGHFLSALFILAGGLSVLETCANPYILEMGPEETATRRLNLAQSFNPIGSMTGVLLSKYFILSNLNQANPEERASMGVEQLKMMQTEELNAVMGPYVGVAFLLVLLWLAIKFTRMPVALDESKKLELGKAFFRLIKKPHYVWGVVAQFFYVGAQLCVWSFTIRYVMQELEINEAAAANYYFAALLLFTVSRFICTWLMRYVTPSGLLTYLSLLAILLSGIVILGGGHVGVYALIGISGCMSLIFPTIFGLASTGLGEDRKIGGSGLIMAIVGGAIMPGVMGLVSDTSTINFAYIVPLICFVIITFYSIRADRLSAKVQTI